MSTSTPTSGALHAQGCIFCLQHDGGFTSREHTFPESLGNDSVILPRGVVCDRCNNGPLADAEQALLQFQPIAFMRVLLGHTNKKGDRPVVKWNNATVSSPAAQEIRIDADNDEAFRIIEADGPMVKGKVSFKTGGPVSPARYRKIARALWKATLDCVYLDHGEVIFEPRFDEVREMVYGNRRAEGFILFPNSLAEPTSEVSLTYQFLLTDLGEVLVSNVVIGGLSLFTELFVRTFNGDRERVSAVANIIEF